MVLQLRLCVMSNVRSFVVDERNNKVSLHGIRLFQLLTEELQGLRIHAHEVASTTDLMSMIVS